MSDNSRYESTVKNIALLLLDLARDNKLNAMDMMVAGISSVASAVYTIRPKGIDEKDAKAIVFGVIAAISTELAVKADQVTSTTVPVVNVNTSKMN
jgi:hypothetical protein